MTDDSQLNLRFTYRARMVMRDAAAEAHKFRCAEVGTEHVLWALLGEGHSVAAKAFDNLQVSLSNISLELDRLVQSGSGVFVSDSPPRTAATENALRNAVDEARDLGHNYVGTEHLLLGLLREESCRAAQLLNKHGVILAKARAEVLRVLANAANTTDCVEPQGPTRDPPGEAEKQFFLSLYRMAVSFYQPRIEGRTGIQLGEIAVWDFDCLHRHVMDRLWRESSPWRIGFIKSWLERRRIRRLSESLAMAYAERARRCAAGYYQSGIYLSFTSGTFHEHGIATTTMHELSHALWERLAGESFVAVYSEPRGNTPSTLKSYNLLVEGFATYAERVWFLDLYPQSARAVTRFVRPGSVYDLGFRQVERLVQENGPQVLMELPRRWREFANTIEH